MPSVLQLLLGGGGNCDFGACGPSLGPSDFVDPNSIEEHHLFIQQFEAWFRAQGIAIDDYLIPLTAGLHRLKAYGGIHTNVGGNWNRVWAEFRAATPGATKDQMFEQARKMIKDFKLGRFPGAILQAPVEIMINPCLFDIQLRATRACAKPLDHI